MSDADRERWDARHSAAGPPSSAPPGVLTGAAELVDAVPVAGRALDVACGRGAVAVWLAQRGLRVDAVDISPTGLAAGARLGAACGVAERIRWIAHDLDGGLPARCTGPYDVVVCQLFRDPARYADLRAVLAPGGLLAVTVLAQSGPVQSGPAQPGAGSGPFRASPGELRAAFRDLDVLLDRESDGEATLLARAPRRRAGTPPTAPPGSPRAPRRPS